MTHQPNTESREHLRTLVQQKNWTALREALRDMPVPDVGDLLLTLPKTDRVLVFRLLPRSLSSAVFAELESHDQNALLLDLSDEETRELLAELHPDDRTNLFEELPGQATQKLLNLLSPEDLAQTRFLLGYPEESVGRLMTPRYVAVRPHWTVLQVLEHIRRQAQSSETLDVIYIVDEKWKLLDALDLKVFVLARPEQTVDALMDHHYEHLSAFEDRENAVQMMQRYDAKVLPVVDSDGILVGIVTVDDVLDVAEEEATEDFHKVAAITPLTQGYLETGPFELFRKRIAWLVALVFMNIFSGAAIASFEDTIAAAVALVFFLPLIIDSGGNAGSQAATLVIRALSLGDIKLGDWWRLLAKDVGVALLLGLVMGATVLGLGIYRGGPIVGIAVALTMVCVVLVGSAIGTLLPLALSRLRIDPATASAPLITSLADISGVLIYFSIARKIISL